MTTPQSRHKQITWNFSEFKEWDHRKTRNEDWCLPSPISEISGGSIAPSNFGLFAIQAYTMGGTRNFIACERSSTDIQLDEFLANRTRPTYELEVLTALAQWEARVRGRTETAVIAPRRAISIPLYKETQDVIALEDNNEVSTHEVLRVLHDNTQPCAEVRKFILQAEVMEFVGEERVTLCKLLHNFVLRNRDSNIPEDLVAVGSAVRKLVAYLATDDLITLSELLTASPRMAIPLETELEIAKTILRKLTWNPPLRDDSEPELADRLMDLAKAYLNTRLLTREKYGAIALNSVLSLLLLRSHNVPTMVALVEALSAKWFTHMVCRRIDRIHTELRIKCVDADFATVTRASMAFADQFRMISE